MELTPQQYERIQQYLDRLMDKEDEKLFLDEVNSNVAMKEHLEFEKQLEESLLFMELEKGFPDLGITDADMNTDFAGADAIKKRIDEAGKNWKQQQNMNPLKPVIGTGQGVKVIAMNQDKRKFWYMAAAACGVIAVVGITVWLSSGPRHVDPVAVDDDSLHKKQKIIIKDPNDTTQHHEKVIPDRREINYASVVKKYYKKDEAPQPEEVPQYLRNQLADYNDDHYSSITNTDLSDPPVARGKEGEVQTIKELGHYYKGLAFIETNNNKQAIENLEWVVDSTKNETLLVKAQWYRGLTYLKSGNIKKAEIDFTRLANNNKSVLYTKQANELLIALKK